MSGLKWFGSAAEIAALGAEQPGINVFPLYAGPFALVKDALNEDFTEGPRQDIELTSARVFKAAMGSDEYAVVLLCRVDETGAPLWSVYCGDKQVSGAFRNDGKTLAAALRKAGKINAKVANAVEASDWVGKVPEMASCSFFRVLKRSGRYCSHTQAALANLPVEDIEEMATELKGWVEGAEVDGLENSPTGGDAKLEEIMDYIGILPIMQVGGAGAGKTHMGRQAATMWSKMRPELPEAKFVEIACHSSMESYEFRCYDRSYEGKIFSVLAGLAEVAHWTQQGIPVVLHLDEYLNAHPSVQKALNTAIAIDGATNCYFLETGEIEALPGTVNKGRMALVQVPRHLLCVIASTNIGPEFQIDKIDPSVRSRFHVVEVQSTTDRMIEIVCKRLVSVEAEVKADESLPETFRKSFELPVGLAENFHKFFDAVNQAVEEGTLDASVSTRFACNIIDVAVARVRRLKARCSTVAQWLPYVKLAVERAKGQCVNFELGMFDQEQSDRYQALVNACFGKPAKK